MKPQDDKRGGAATAAPPLLRGRGLRICLAAGHQWRIRKGSLMSRAKNPDVSAALDRARGALVGLALGDALGTTLEFSGRDTRPPVTDIVGGGPFGLAAGSWRAKERDAISSSGYVVHTLETALWCVDRSESIEDALILAANLADDADTVAAVTGQLAGALWGVSGAPAAWLDKLAWRDRLEALAADLFEAANSERAGTAE